MKRLICLTLSLIMVLGLCACGGETAPQGFQGLVLKAPSDVRVSLLAGFEEGLAVKPAETYTEEGYTYYRYTGLEGAYRCQTTGLGYYDTIKNIPVSQADNQKETLVDVTPAKKVSTGWEAESVQIFADTLLKGALSDDIAQWPEYQSVFTTPWFTEEHADHQTTTQAQMEAYLTSLDDQDDNLYLYSTGISSTFRNDIPMAVLTESDLSGVTTLEEAAKVLDNGKPTLLFRCQLHGNEPAAGEAGLAVVMLLDSAWGKYLEKINVCVVPRGNPDSAQNFIRNVAGSTDPNRDSLRIRTEEVENYMNLCQLLTPEVIVDGHEFQCHVVDEQVEGGDMLVGAGYTQENTAAFRKVGLEIAAEIFTGIQENGLECRYYSNAVNSINANVSRNYASNQGTLFFLLESRGIGMGTMLYPRRVVSHVIALERILDYISQDTEKILSTVAAEQQYIIDSGSVYSEEHKIAIKTEETPSEELAHPGVIYDQITGETKNVTVTPLERLELSRYVIAPTAYVIPAGESFTKNVLELMDQHGITYTFIPKGSKVMLQQYGEKELLEETKVTFPEGAYVFCKNQIQGFNLSQLMEPEIEDHGSTKGTLVAQNIIRLENGKYPIYRYIHDLNEKGFIDYQK